MKKVLLLIYALCFAGAVWGQQEPQFSNCMLNNVIHNPAFVGINGKWNVSGIQREQWSGIEGAPSVSLFSLDLPFNFMATKHGFGILFLSEKYGSSTKAKMTAVSISYAYKFNLFEGQCSIGARVNYINQSFEGSMILPKKRVWDLQRQILENVFVGSGIKSSETVFDYTTGIFFRNSSFFLGASVNHLFEPSIYSVQNTDVDGDMQDVKIQLMRHFYGSAGYVFNVGRDLKLNPSLYIISDFSFYQFTGNMSLLFKDRYWIGSSYRQKDALIFFAGFDFMEGLRIGYAYDYGVSGISKKANGSHELMVSYSFDIKFRNQKYISVRFL